MLMQDGQKQKTKSPLSRFFGAVAGVFKSSENPGKAGEILASCIDPIGIFRDAAKKEKERFEELSARFYGTPVPHPKKYVNYSGQNWKKW